LTEFQHSHIQFGSVIYYARMYDPSLYREVHLIGKIHTVFPTQLGALHISHKAQAYVNDTH
jgi:hypothetical protein